MNEIISVKYEPFLVIIPFLYLQLNLPIFKLFGELQCDLFTDGQEKNLHLHV